jgi:hypothetical protein
MNVATVVASLELRVGIGGPPRNLRLEVETTLHDVHGMPPLRAAEVADRLHDKVAAMIAEREANLNAPTLRLVGSTSNIVAGFAHAMPGEPAEVAALRLQRAHVDAIYAAMRGLTFQQFEDFGARFLRELGAGVGRVTPHSNDQGIDFYGEFNLGQLHAAPEPFLVLARDMRLLFAGQAKHYPNRTLGPSAVRELVGAMSLARTKTHSSDGVDIFRELSIRPFSPVLSLIFTTGEFTGGALKLAEAAGVVAKTGLQLAVFLADRGVGIVQQNGTRTFSMAAFLEWLNEAVPGITKGANAVA